MKGIIAKKRIKEKGVPKMVLAALISYLMIVPIVFFDIMLEIYHRICFWIYGLPYVERKKYISFDRVTLKYLSFGDKINCIYCGYANGFIYYAYTIISETEKYWCPIKHQKRKNKLKFLEPPHHKDFVEFGDKESLKKYLEKN
jgi:hypothetical protein